MKIRYLIMHAYGTGGTIRTVFTQASTMAAAGHDVEVVSVLRRSDEPRFPLDPRVRLWALTDQRPHAPAEELPRGPLARRRAQHAAAQAGKPPHHIPEGEFGHSHFDRRIELATIDYLRQLTDGILVTTRPALNILAALFATSGVVKVAQEHMNLSTHRPDVREAIARLYPAFDAVAVLTHRDRQDYEQWAPGTRVVRVPNAVHSLKQKPSTCSSKIAVAAGRFRTQKGFDMLIPAFAQAVEEFPDWQLRIFGSGEKQGQLRRLIEKHHMYNHIFLMGMTDKLDDELAKASMYVLSSRFEGLPMVMLEAMSHALPVVSFDCPTGPADVITDGKEGLLVPPRDVDGLARAMKILMADEGLRAEMGDAALMTVQDYSPESVHAQWTELFEELLAEKRR
ncbi:glycosyltransferase family 4 protein [Streptomyces sp. 7-21]|jgi:glycosyltransferase involved in cell wall biosynthesis|uniref:glycosyltransferase family 4 protein n=1 Tax=Streptomyces sp. 7-21 TaxID=2802283 RepID=UPI001920382F|nr:glycosyltransferase family 4 protein [Streptomyces sp. 7-21]MBL1068838.1 glycosyltransferase family 4 protein [Streptomyces sp. 7-21]